MGKRDKRKEKEKEKGRKGQESNGGREREEEERVAQEPMETGGGGPDQMGRKIKRNG